MIENLDDFKIATKRIPKILKTFDITKPEPFKLSNSASLNFMARILGYENYNTIKPVFDKKISKGNIMKIIKYGQNECLNATHLISWENAYSLILTTSNVEKPIKTRISVELFEKLTSFMISDEPYLDLYTLNKTFEKKETKPKLSPSDLDEVLLPSW